MTSFFYGRQKIYSIGSVFRPSFYEYWVPSFIGQKSIINLPVTMLFAAAVPILGQRTVSAFGIEGI